jgi:hypothetical protein
MESKRRQYDLVEVARQRGFVDVEVIDDDLGRARAEWPRLAPFARTMRTCRSPRH